jgi:transcription elongation GreA/GreB family factor
MNTYVPTLTEHGQDKILNDYKALKSKYSEVTAELRRVGMGSLDDAFSTSVKKVEQLFLEDQLKKIQHIIDRMRIVKKAKSSKVADVGNKVEYQHGENRYTITLVDPLEADPSVGFIPVDSPLGRAIAYKKVNQTVDVVAPRMTYQIKLLKIS